MLQLAKGHVCNGHVKLTLLVMESSMSKIPWTWLSVLWSMSFSFIVITPIAFLFLADEEAPDYGSGVRQSGTAKISFDDQHFEKVWYGHYYWLSIVSKT